MQSPRILLNLDTLGPASDRHLDFPGSRIPDDEGDGDHERLQKIQPFGRLQDLDPIRDLQLHQARTLQLLVRIAHQIDHSLQGQRVVVQIGAPLLGVSFALDDALNLENGGPIRVRPLEQPDGEFGGVPQVGRHRLVHDVVAQQGDLGQRNFFGLRPERAGAGGKNQQKHE